MVEISKSGSGEGLGGVIPWGYSTISSGHARDLLAAQLTPRRSLGIQACPAQPSGSIHGTRSLPPASAIRSRAHEGCFRACACT